MDLYNQLVTEVLVSDVSTKGWREFVAKYTPQAHRKDLFVQFTNFASSTDDKRMVGSQYGRSPEPGYEERYWTTNRKKLGLKAARTPHPDTTLWTKPNHSDPAAIYTYPLEFVISEQAGIPYAGNSRYLRVIKLRPNAKVLDLQTLTKDAALKILNVMEVLPQGDDVPVEKFWQDIWEMTASKVSPHPVTVPKAFFFASQSGFDLANTVNGYKLFAKRVLNHNDQRARFLKAGISVVIDTAKGPEDAVVYHGEPEQAFFMRSDAFDIIDVFQTAQQKKGEYNPSVWNPERSERKVISRVINAIDPRDQIIRLGAVHGGIQAFTNPLPTTGKVNLSMPRVAITKRGRAVSTSIKFTDKGEVPGKPKHRQEGQHIRATTGVSAYTEGGVIDYSIGRDQTLDDGVSHIAKLAHDVKPRSEWKPIRGIDPRAAVWRDVLIELHRRLKAYGQASEIDLDHVVNTAPHVSRGLKELFGTIHWHWTEPKTEWGHVSVWMAANEFYAQVKRRHGIPHFQRGVTEALKVRDSMKAGEESAAIKPTELKKLQDSPVYEAAKAIMIGTCAEGFYDHQLDDMINGMAELFEKRYVVMMEGSFANFDVNISKDLPRLIEACDILNYNRHLKEMWKTEYVAKRSDADDADEQFVRFHNITGQSPHPDWDKVDEMIIGRNYDLPTSQQNSAPAQSISKQNPVGKLSKDVHFQSARKPAVVRNPKMAAARRAVEKAVKRTLSWATDHSTGSATAYIGNGRKVRIGDQHISVGPRVTPLNVNKMPSDEQLAKMLS
jgi:hypothetical protein